MKHSGARDRKQKKVKAEETSDQIHERRTSMLEDKYIHNESLYFVSTGICTCASIWISYIYYVYVYEKIIYYMQ